MVARIASAGTMGVEGYLIDAEFDLSAGLPGFDVVGLPDAAVKESRDRVRAAIKNCGFTFPLRRLTVNLAPADLRKEGTLYDLPLFFGILAVSEQIAPLPEGCCFIGELSLTGDLRPVPGVLPMALAARDAGVGRIFVPRDNGAEAACAAGLTVYAAGHVKELLAHFSGEHPLSPLPAASFCPKVGDGPDFSDVMGQENVKRALEIAAAGGHNVLMVGPPGSGKSMLARRLASILPGMDEEEAMTATKIYSVAGLLSKDRPFIDRRPFRAPHHTVSAAALAGGGGGRFPRPGEVSLAHGGVLFLDELPEFRKDALEVLRQPVEDGRVTISRVAGSQVYPSRFMLVCAMTPCKCGWYGHPDRCTCTETAVQAYNARVSGPLLDRIDLHVSVPPVEYAALARRSPAEASAAIRARVVAARERQRARFAADGFLCNAAIPPALMARYCALDSAGETLMASAFEALGLTARAHDRILKAARTIADLAGSEKISAVHLAEALQFRPSARP